MCHEFNRECIRFTLNLIVKLIQKVSKCKGYNKCEYCLDIVN